MIRIKIKKEYTVMLYLKVMNTPNVSRPVQRSMSVFVVPGILHPCSTHISCLFILPRPGDQNAKANYESRCPSVRYICLKVRYMLESRIFASKMMYERGMLVLFEYICVLEIHRCVDTWNMCCTARCIYLKKV